VRPIIDVSPGGPTHHALIGAGVVVVEGLDLFEVTPATYTLICLPLRMAGGDGSPARAILAVEAPSGA
jgi:arylformamidase